jgi:hypothetical protein
MFFSLPRGSKIFQICHDANFFTPDLTLFSKLKKYHVYWGVSFYSRSTNIILSNLVYMPSSFLPTSFCSLDSKMRRKSCPCSPFQVLWIQNCSPQMLYRLLRSASSSKSCSSSSKIHVFQNHRGFTLCLLPGSCDFKTLEKMPYRCLARVVSKPHLHRIVFLVYYFGKEIWKQICLMSGSGDFEN